MAKTKTQSTEEKGGKSSEQLTSFGQFFQASNLLPQSQELHKGLNMNSRLFPNVEQETSSKQNTSKRKRKSDVSFSTSFEYNENNASDQIDNVSNTTSNYGSLKKGKKSKSNNVTSDNTPYDAFTPKRLPKEEDNQEDYNQNNHENSYRSQMSSEEMEEEKDSELIKSVEEKVKKIQVLQDIQLSPTKVIKDPKQMLHYRYPNLNQLDMKTDLKLHDTDEIFLFRTPKNVDPQVLENLDIDIETGGKVKIGLKKYIVRPTSQIPHPVLILAKRNKIVNFKRHIVMEMYVKPPKESKSLIVERSSIELPNELKNRHPLFGCDFEEKINLNQTVEKKIDDAITNLLKQKKKKKVKKSAKKDPGKPEIGASFESIMAGKPVKKKRMTKSALIEETLNLMKQELNTESDSEALLHKKKKSKSKKGQRDRDQNDFLSNLSVKEETPKDKIINSTMVANSSSKSADFSADVSYIPPDPSKKAKIKKEKKLLLNNDTFLDSSSSKKRTHAEEPEDVAVHKKKKKKKKLEID